MPQNLTRPPLSVPTLPSWSPLPFKARPPRASSVAQDPPLMAETEPYRLLATGAVQTSTLRPKTEERYTTGRVSGAGINPY